MSEKVAPVVKLCSFRGMLLLLVRIAYTCVCAVATAIQIGSAVVEFVVTEVIGVLGLLEQRITHQHDDRLIQVEYGGGYIRECRKCGRAIYEKR